MTSWKLRRWGLSLVGLWGLGCALDDRSPGVADDTGQGRLDGAETLPQAASNASSVGPASSGEAGGVAGEASNTPGLAAAPMAAATPGGPSSEQPASPSSGCVEGASLIDFDAVYTAVAADLGAAASTDAAFFRYLTLGNRFARSGCNGAAIETDRQALTKLVNMLSLGSAVTAPIAIDPDRTLYRLDLRNYRWDRAISVNGQNFNDVWEAAVSASPFAVEFLGSVADLTKDAAQTAVPVMFADAFLDSVATGDLYYASIGVPTGDAIDNFILNSLQIDVDSDLASGTQIRAGTTRSDGQTGDVLVQGDPMGVGQGRLWQAFVLEPEVSVFDAPLVIEAGRRTAIFTLPNGMMAFMIADATGTITVDSDFLLDTSQLNFRAITAVSCSSCHTGGLISFTDEVRDIALANARTVGLTRDQVEQVEVVYPAPSVFARTIAADSLSYQAALRQLQLPTTGEDPVAAAFSQFDNGLTLPDAAADLGVTPAALLGKLPVLAPALGPLGTGFLDRDDFAQVYVDSLCRTSIAQENRPDPAACSAAARAAAAP